MKVPPLTYEQGLIVRELSNSILTFHERKLSVQDAMMALLYTTAGVIVTCTRDEDAALATTSTFMTLLPARVYDALSEVGKAGAA